MSGQKKGLFGRFGRLFVQPVASSSGESAVEQTDGEGDNPLTLGEGATMLSVVGSGEITSSDPDLLNKIRVQVIGSAENSLYAQFLGSMEKLEEVILDPTTLVRAVLVTTGIKPQELVATIQKVHLPNLVGICDSLNMSSSARTQEQMKSLQAELTRIADGQKILRHQITEMEEQLLAGESRAGELNSEIEQLSQQERIQRDELGQVAAQIRTEFEDSLRTLNKL
jgi:hypothetical protein